MPRRKKIWERPRYPQNIYAAIPHYQQAVVYGSEELREGVLPDVLHQISNTPHLYAQDGKGMTAIVHLHYFYGGHDWFVTERNPEDNMAFGYAVLNGDLEMSELGYIDINALHKTGKVELDFHFEPKALDEELHERWPDYFDKPAQKKENPRHIIKTTAKDLWTIFESIHRSMAAKDDRECLNGMNILTVLDISGEVVHFTCSDGHRLSSFNFPINDRGATVDNYRHHKIDVIIPYQAVIDIKRKLDDLLRLKHDEMRCELLFYEKRGEFLTGGDKISFTYVDDEYVNFFSVTPKPDASESSVIGTHLTDLRKANQFAWWVGEQEKAKGKRKKEGFPVLTISTKENNAMFSGENKSLDIGQSIEGKDDYHFNAVYVKNIFDSCQHISPRIYLWGGDGSMKMLVTDGEHCLHLLMGMRV